MTKEEWNTVYFSTMAIASVAIGALSVTIALLALQRSQAQTVGVGSLEPPTGVAINVPRVHYERGQVLVEVRNPGEWHELREFIQPDNPDILRIVRSIGG